MIDMAKMFDKGVAYYTYVDLSIQFGFPEDQVCCRWCPFIRHYDSLDRDKCAITEDILYSRETRGRNCPLVILNQVETEELNK